MASHVTYVKNLTIDGTELPANTASLSRSANMIDNSNFLTSADGFSSRIVGLADWGVEAQGHLGNVQGYNAVLKTSGTATTLTTEATTKVSGKIYQITDATKRVLDPDTAVVVSDGDGALEAGKIESIDYLFGIITLASNFTPNGSVTVSGKYLPMTVVAQTNGGFSLEMTGNVLDATDRATAQSNGGYKVNKIGLIDVSAQISRLDDLAMTYADLLLARTPFILELTLANGALMMRGWFVLGAANAEGEVSGLEMENLEFALYGKTDINFGFVATAALNDGIEALITKFFARTAAAVTYLPDGTNGQGGDAYVSSMSISGDMDTETWSVSLVGAGALTDEP